MFKGPNYVEYDVNVYKFGVMARKGFNSYLSMFKDLDLSVGFVIQAGPDEEQPENILGCARIMYPNHVDLPRSPAH
jgi:hypothetical protein